MTVINSLIFSNSASPIPETFLKIFTKTEIKKLTEPTVSKISECVCKDVEITSCIATNL